MREWQTKKKELINGVQAERDSFRLGTVGGRGRGGGGDDKHMCA